MSTKLIAAVRNNDLELTKTLIATGCDINESDSSKRTPLHMAVWTGNYEIVKTLVLANANLTAKAQDMFTALHFASQKPNSQEIIKLLVRKDKTLLNMKISKGNKTALHLAVHKGYKENIQMLLELGADIHTKTNSGQTALELSQDSEIISILKTFIDTKESKTKNKKEDNEIVDGVEGDVISTTINKDHYTKRSRDQDTDEKNAEIVATETSSNYELKKAKVKDD